MTSARPVLWFVAAQTAITFLHEATHAGVAYLAGVPGTLFNFLVDLDRSHATTSSLAVIGVSGPLVCLLAGGCLWMAYRRSGEARVRLPLVLLSIFALSTFCGNLMSAAFAGDFSAAARLLEVPLPVRYATSAVGAIATATVMFLGGRALAGLAPAGSGQLARVTGMVLVPVAAGTALVVLINWPMPGVTAMARIGEAAFWLFALAGAGFARSPSRGTAAAAAVRLPDLAALLASVLVVRILMAGIPFMP